MRGTRSTTIHGTGAASLLLAGLCLSGLVVATSAAAQSGAVKSGIRGRVVIDPQLRAATVWPVTDKDPWYRTAANVRRGMGRGVSGPVFQPAPQLLVVLEGAKEKQAEPRTLSIEGMRFVPSSLLVPKPARLKVYNRQSTPMTVTLSGKELAVVEPDKSQFIELEAGEHAIELKELPFAQANVRVLGAAMVLPVGDNGLIDAIPVEGGDYKLAFYHGAEPLLVQEVGIPESEYIAIDASISTNRVVTVSVKDGGLRVIRSPRPVAPPPPEEGDPEDGAAPSPRNPGTP